MITLTASSGRNTVNDAPKSWNQACNSSSLAVTSPAEMSRLAEREIVTSSQRRTMPNNSVASGNRRSTTTLKPMAFTTVSLTASNGQSASSCMVLLKAGDVADKDCGLLIDADFP